MSRAATVTVIRSFTYVTISSFILAASHHEGECDADFHA